jgi:hypothetical protein
VAPITLEMVHGTADEETWAFLFVAICGNNDDINLF